MNQLFIKRQTPPSIKFVSWNVLADCLHDGGFADINPDYMKWDNRKLRLLEVIDSLGPIDVLALQEVDHVEDFWIPALTLRCLVVAGVAYKNGRSHGTLIAVSHRFEITNVTILDKNNEAVLVNAVDYMGGNKPLTFASAHLKAKPENAHIRLAEVKNLLDAQWSDGVILGGDFNAETNEDCLALVGKAFQNAYDEDSWTTWKKRDTVVQHRIDHVFHRNAVVLSTLAPLSSMWVLQNGLLPGRKYPSDHIPVGGEFVFE